MSSQADSGVMSGPGPAAGSGAESGGPSAGIDRLAPTRRPGGHPVGYQRWRALSFLHWRVPASVLRPLVPAELALDDFGGSCFVGLVPFTMHGVRPAWAPSVPWLSHFHETNVRTYVHLYGRDPGVWFFSLEAANRLAVWLARRGWGLPYHHARMSLSMAADGRIDYASTRRAGGAICNVTALPLTAPAAVAPGTLEHFLIERYVLYAVRGGRLHQGRIHHAPYPVQKARVVGYEETLLAAAGIPRAGEPIGHYASGVDVEIFRLKAVARGG